MFHTMRPQLLNIFRKHGCIPFSRRLSSNFGRGEEMFQIEDSVPAIPASAVKVPYANEKMKVEMYERHKSDPEEWSIRKLCEHYGSSFERTKAIIYLMRHRETVMAENQVLDVSDEWKSIYKRHVEGGEEVSMEDLTKEFSLPEQQIKDILERMKLHTFRIGNVNQYEELMNKKLDLLKKMGVDTRFQETAIFKKKSSKDSDAIDLDDYYPELFGDDDDEAYNAAVDKLKAAIRESKNSTTANLPEGDGNVPEFIKSPLPEIAAEQVSEAPNTANVKQEGLSRWKIAFRDLSLDKDHPTMIRTRSGKWRQATPLEEIKRSWRKHPTELDMRLYEDKIAPFVDPDGDEDSARQLSVAKTERRKQLLEERKEKANA